MPVPPARSTADLVEQVLARVRAPGVRAAPEAPGEAEAPAARTPPGAAGLADLPVRAPPGASRAPAAALRGPAAAKPPRAPAPAPAAQSAPQGAVPHSTPPHAAAAPAGAAPPKAASPAAAAGGPEPVNVASLIDDNAPWLPPEPERRTAFLQVYRYWRKQVRPEYAEKAVPAFLFLVTALPVMIKARDDLKALNLWEPPGEHSRQARDLHPAWKKYCDFLPRAQQALQELDAYRHLSLLTALDDLDARITKAEKRFREGLPTGRR